MNIQVPISKSIYNRILILKALFPDQLKHTAIQTELPSDCRVLQKNLTDWSLNKEGIFNAQDAGTAFRFLTAFFACSNRTQILTGTNRMKARPIKGLVKALNDMGASISYMEKDGYPPLRIGDFKQKSDCIAIDASKSSQFISALLLIAPSLKKGLSLRLKGDKVSRSYVSLTLTILKQLDINLSAIKDKIIVNPLKELSALPISIENDWSSIGYWYNWCLSTDKSIRIGQVKPYSIQGDSVLAKEFSCFGITSTFQNNNLYLESNNTAVNGAIISINCISTPDLFLTFVCSSLLTKKKIILSGLNTLADKESNRIEVAKDLLIALNVSYSFEENQLEIEEFPVSYPKCLIINSIDDHRVVLSFSALKPLIPGLRFDNTEVVKKSYPNYWVEVEKINQQLNLKLSTFNL